MADLSYAQLKGVWLSASQGTKYHSNGWATLMAAIAEAESSGNPEAYNPTDNGGTQTSWGLWQISLGNHAAPSPNWASPEENARLAIGKLNSQGLSAWGTYDSGAYKAYLSGKTAADLTGITGTSAVDTAALTSAAAAESDCAWKIAGFNLHNIGLGPIHGPTFSGICIFSKSELRALIGAGVLFTGATMALTGVGIVLLVAGLKAGRALTKAAGPAVALIPGVGPEAAAATSAAAAQPSVPRTRGPMSSPQRPRTGGRTQQGSQSRRTRSSVTTAS